MCAFVELFLIRCAEVVKVSYFLCVLNIDSITYGSYNVNGLQNRAKRKQVFTLLKEHKLDIVMLQESHSTDNLEHLWKAEWGGQMYCSHGSSESRGVMILFWRALDYTVSNIYKDPQGRAIILEILIQKTSYLLVNVYAPNSDDPDFFITLSQKIEHFDNRNIIWGGDFSLVLNVDIDRYNSKTNNKKAQAILQAYIAEANLVDVWRIKNPDARLYTFIQNRPLALSRIDYFLIADGLLPQVSKCNIVSTPLTDHSLITLEITIAEQKRGPGLWKFNSSYLANLEFLNDLNKIIDATIKDVQRLSLHDAWEAVKEQIIDLCKRRTKLLSLQKNQRLCQLYEKLNHIKKLIDAHPEDFDQVAEEYKKVSLEVQEHLDCKARGILLRSKMQWYHQGERSSKYFFSLEKNNAKRKRILELKMEQGQISNNQKKIMDCQMSFYSKLYQKDPTVKYDIRLGQDARKLSQEQKDQLEQTLKFKELTEAVKSMSNGKTPGADGLPIEIYKVLWNKIGQVLFQAFLTAHNNKQLFRSATVGVITLIPKKDRDTLYLKNWRPLTTLNCDYEILAKALASRLKEVLPYIIDAEQTGYMCGRNIATNIRRTIEIIEYTKKCNIPTIILSADFEKCFDRIKHSSIWAAMNDFNFGPTYIQWVKLLFDDFHSCIINNGHVSPLIPITRSVHQGCPISAYLQLICSQVMTYLIKSNVNIKGINMYGLKQIISQFADDTDLFLNFDQKTFDNVFHVFDVLRTNIGFKLNYDKTTIYRIGSLANTNAQLYTKFQVNWTNDPINVLGVLVSNETATLAYENFVQIFDKIHSTLDSWSQRSLTLTGRVIIVNTLLASLFVYKMQVLPNIPFKMIQLFNETILKFLWNKKRPKISFQQLTLDKPNGGLRLVDLFLRQMSLKAQWVTIIRNSQEWQDIVYPQLCPLIKDKIWSVNLHIDDIPMIQPLSSFWTQVLYAWCMFNYVKPLVKQTFLNQIVWFNSEVKIDNRVVMNCQAWNANLVFVKQFFDEQGNVVSYANILNSDGNVITWFQYSQLIAAIVDRKRTLAHGVDLHGTLTNFQKLENSCKISHIVYTKLIDVPSRLNDKRIKWEQRLNIDIDYEQFLKNFNNVSEVTIATKYRDFQCTLLHNAVVTNRHLFLWKIRHNDMCSFCNDQVETVLHLFVDCPLVKSLWSKVKDYIQTNAPFQQYSQCEWNPEYIIFNTVHPNPSHVINLHTVIAKQFIYRQRCLNSALTFFPLEKEF